MTRFVCVYAAQFHLVLQPRRPEADERTFQRQRQVEEAAFLQRECARIYQQLARQLRGATTNAMYCTGIFHLTMHSFISRQESLLNGRIEPCGVVDGFTVELGASGSFCPKHVTLPVTAYFFKLSEDNAPSTYLVSACVLGECKCTL